MTEQEQTTDTKINDDYDSPWKTAVEQYFPEFMKFFFPDAYAKIDWSKGYIFLDQELMALSRDAELGKRLLDKLARVTLLTGAEEMIYVHIEVQGDPQPEFPKRMFVYNYRIYDHYDRPVASMAVLADNKPSWRPDHFSYSALGSEVTLRFPIVKLTDYRERLDELLASENAFALVTAAHILTRKTRKHAHDRYNAKSRLVRILYQRQWDKQRIINLFNVIDCFLTLPEELEQKLWNEIQTIEEKQKMPYVSSIERIGIAKGREEGREEGVLIGEAKLLKKQLERRFGAIPAWVSDKLSGAGEQELECWGEAILSALTLDAVFKQNAHH